MVDCGTALRILPEFDPGNVSIQGCTLQAEEISPEDTATLEYTIANDNAANATVTVQLLANGQVLASEDRTVQRNDTTSGSLSFSPLDTGLGDGNYTMAVEIAQAQELSGDAARVVADGGAHLDRVARAGSGGCNCGH